VSILAEKELAAVKPQKDTVLTIGVFDGVHLGHKHLIAEARAAAVAVGALSGVVTFRSHPVELFDPDAGLPYLTSLEEKLRLIKAEGVDLVVALTFDRGLASLTAEQFATLLKTHLRMRGLVIGPDFALGRGRAGNVEALRRLGNTMGFSVTVVPPLEIGGEVVSSTAIRRALAAGDMARVVRLAGRPYMVKGKVIAGTGLGRKIGYPTANLKIEKGWAIPRDGVYATLTHINGNVLNSMTSIGMRPTFDGKNRTVETYVVDYEGDLYGKEVAIDIVDYLREEKKFANADELKTQISLDIKQGEAILGSRRQR
jgi:riboflavin kinase/FMN adenylyltransferase